MIYLNEKDQLESRVRKYIDKSICDVEGLLIYLNENETLERKALLGFFTNKRLTRMLPLLFETFDTISKSDFITRLPIYFHDTNALLDKSINEHSYMEWLFENYYEKHFRPDVNDPSNSEYRYRSRGFFSNLSSEVNYDELFTKLIRIFYDYNIDYSSMFRYLISQVGGMLILDIFEKWYLYLEYVDKNVDGSISYEDAFPFNILYSLNEKLEKNGKDPIMYLPDIVDNNYFKYSNKRDYIQFEGYFPYDEDFNINFKWVGLWFANEIKIVSEPKNVMMRKMNDEDRLSRFYEGKLNIKFRIYVDVNTIVMILNKSDSYQTNYVWKQIYCGTNLIEFNPKYISLRREKLGLQQQEAAKLASINLRTYQRIENGESLPDIKNMLKIMQLFGIDDSDDLIEKRELIDSGLEKFSSGESLNYFLQINLEKEPNFIDIKCPYCGNALGKIDIDSSAGFVCKECKRKLLVRSLDKNTIVISNRNLGEE